MSSAIPSVDDFADASEDFDEWTGDVAVNDEDFDEFASAGISNSEKVEFEEGLNTVESGNKEDGQDTRLENNNLDHGTEAAINSAKRQDIDIESNGGLVNPESVRVEDTHLEVIKDNNGGSSDLANDEVVGFPQSPTLTEHRSEINETSLSFDDEFDDFGPSTGVGAEDDDEFDDFAPIPTTNESTLEIKDEYNEDMVTKSSSTSEMPSAIFHDLRFNEDWSSRDAILENWKILLNWALPTQDHEANRAASRHLPISIKDHVLNAHESLHAKLTWHAVTTAMDREDGLPRLRWNGSNMEALYLTALGVEVPNRRMSRSSVATDSSFSLPQSPMSPFIPYSYPRNRSTSVSTSIASPTTSIFPSIFPTILPNPAVHHDSISDSSLLIDAVPSSKKNSNRLLINTVPIKSSAQRSNFHFNNPTSPSNSDTWLSPTDMTFLTNSSSSLKSSKPKHFVDLEDLEVESLKSSPKLGTDTKKVVLPAKLSPAAQNLVEKLPDLSFMRAEVIAFPSVGYGDLL